MLRRIVFGLVVGALSSTSAFAQDAPAAAAQAAPTARLFASDAGMVLNFIKPDKTADFEAVIGLMAQGAYDATGWVTEIAIGDVVDEGFEALHAGKKMKVLVDPTVA